MSIRPEIWNGTLPLKIVLASNESRTRDGQHEYMVVVNRISYLPIYLSSILKYFRPYLNNPKDSESPSWWFEFEGVPIRWNWPIGLSYDLLTGLDPTHEKKNTTDQNTTLPWTLTLKHKEYPVEYILAYNGIEALADNWLNQCKQACCVRDGNPKAIMSLSKSESTDLWVSILEHKFDKYWSIMDRVLPSPVNYKNIPIKLYFPMSNQVRQALVAPFTENVTSSSSSVTQHRQTVGSALNHHLPDLFPSRRRCVLARPLMHGVVLPMEATVVELLPQCMYLDGFLHISIVMMS